MTYQARMDETVEWLNYLQPEGLVVGPNILRERGLNPIRQTPLDTEDAAQALGLPTDARREDDRLFELHDAWRFFETVLEWSAKLVAGAPGGPPIPPELTVTVPEHETLLAPDMVVLWKGDAPENIPAQALVMLHPSLEADDRNQFPSSEWEASPHQRLERLLRETNVGVGLLVARNTLRLVYAPRGETAGWLSWPLAPLGRVEGRPMLAGLKLCLGRSAFFAGAPETRLRALLEASRAAQNEVSEKLSGQVLGTLHELLRGLHRAAPERIEALAENNPQHLYEGLLTCLMRLVFLLYAEDRDLLPSSPEPALRQLWEKGYSIKTLYMRLLTDEALNPDTMDDRRGGWGQLLAVFRLIHAGYPGWVTGRGGKLFDPEGFPFLEGREKGQGREDATVLPVSDGCILRILHGLMTIEGRGLSNEKIRERLSYRSLDVESIGSVYETVMGFTTDRASERMIALRDEKKLPTFIGLDTLLAQKPADRQKWLKDKSIKLSAKQAKAVKEAGDVAALVEAFGTLVDERASPKATPIGPGAPFLQPTEERRRSGSHYTPRSLTEPIARHALEPAFERIGERASPEAVLSLKILDPACGSGAFLVEACRQLGQRLEQAWNMYGAEKPVVPPDEDEALHARRLVAQKCLYGVDRNPMAVDLARLSLWLATLARDHEFTFLDHALKSGDSLVGLTRDEIAAAHWDASKPGLPLFRTMIKEAVERAMQGREAIRNAGDDARIEAQAARYSRVLDASEPARIVGDAVIAAFFAADKPRKREEDRATVESWIAGSLTPDWEQLRRKGEAFRTEQGWRPFHWEIEFPEAFARDNPGFDAIVGNPPFAGKNTISAGSGPRYLPWLQTLHEGAHGNADLVAHFFRRAFGLLREGSAFGLIATNTIGQGDTRDTGLAAILRAGGVIYRATKRYQWPNEGAAVVVSIVHTERARPARDLTSSNGGETPPLPHRGWHTPRNLPHFDSPAVTQSITFRLHDSLPAALLAQSDESDAARRERIEAALDRGDGACLLRDPALAAIVEGGLRHGAGSRYDLHAYVIMPNHVHVLVTPYEGARLADILHSWKSWSAKEINRARGGEGVVWQRDYFDRFIRDEAHFHRALFYIENNPVAAGLVATAEDWRFSSASRMVGGETPPPPEGARLARHDKRDDMRPTRPVALEDRARRRAPILDGREVRRISAYLVAGDFDEAPARLAANASKAFIGTFLLGMGFTFDDVAAAKGEAEPIAEMERLIASDPRNAERIKPYIGGEEVNNSPTHAHHRYAIDFEDFPLLRDPADSEPWCRLSEEARRTKLRMGIVSTDYPAPVATDWPELAAILERRVKPHRSEDNRERYARIWWQYAERRPGLRRATVSAQHVLVVPCGATPHLGFGRLPGGMIWSHLLFVLAFPNLAPFAVLQSRVHEIWARFFSSSMKDDLRYAPSDCFETFPFPPGFDDGVAASRRPSSQAASRPSSYDDRARDARAPLEAIGQAYHDHRAALMIAADEGMTKTYNRFHKSDERGEPIRRLRELHDEMDRAVLRAYGWDDLAEELRPQFLTEETEDDHTYQNRYFWPAEEVAAGLAPERAARRSAEEADEAQDALDLS